MTINVLPQLAVEQPKFQSGTVLVYHNLWTGWDAPKRAKWFRWLTPEECEQLAPGDRIWYDLDPLHPSGKVYGCVLVEVTRIIGTLQTGLSLTYESPRISGGKKILKDGSSDFAVLVDEERLYKYTQKHPLALNAGSSRIVDLVK